MINLEQILEELSKERPVFHSEKDFQFALAWKIREMYPETKIRLEKREIIKIGNNEKPHYVDIYIEDAKGRKTYIELKYRTKKLTKEINGEEYELKNQAAQPISRYDFIKDIQTLEQITENNPGSTGYAVFLTNDPSYWTQPRKPQPIDKNFRIHEGAVLEGKIEWSEKTSPNTKKNREKQIILKNSYKLQWKTYYKEEDYEFRYLLLEIKH